MALQCVRRFDWLKLASFGSRKPLLEEDPCTLLILTLPQPVEGLRQKPCAAGLQVDAQQFFETAPLLLTEFRWRFQP